MRRLGWGWALLIACAIPLAPVFAQSTSTDATAPVASADGSYPRLTNEFVSAVVMDAKRGTVLYQFQGDKVWSAASLTKLMGALVFLDRKLPLSKIVSLKASDEVGGGRLRVKTGATLSIQDLLYSSITASANNAATALARLSGLGMKGFVNTMNAKAKKLKLTHTHFVDPSGMDPQNKTTATEMARLALQAFQNPLIRRFATTSEYRFVIRNTGQLKDLKNTNQLLYADGVYVTGGKTGFLYESLYNLAVRVRPDQDASGRELMIVVFGAPTRDGSFQSAKALANWTWNHYDRAP